MYRSFLVLTSLFILSTTATSLPAGKPKINWLTVEEVQEKVKEDPKPVLIDLYTNWCYWCKVMDKKTYNNAKVIEYINKHFYAVKVNAESKETIEWGNQKYFYNPGNRVNEFALYLTSGQLGFPTTVIFPEAGKEPAAIPGFMNPKEMESILKYFGEQYYKRQDYTEFTKALTKTW